MAGSTRAELASSSLDGSTFSSGYQSGLRGNYVSPSLERPGSFRESHENRLMASASRNSSPSFDPSPLSQYLPLEPLSTSELNLKYSRQWELRRALGISVEEHSFGSLQSKHLFPIASEELKRFKASVFETSTRARDRAKLLQESILKLDKYRNFVTKRRQRSEAQPIEKPISSSFLKVGNQTHLSNSDNANARPEERLKLASIPNRRVRSSMAELENRSTISAKLGAATDKEKNLFFEKDKLMLRSCGGGGPMSGDDRIRVLPAGGDGWEKKLKRKRSVGTMGTRVSEGERELKQTIQTRPNSEPRSCPSDANGFRTGSANGAIGSNKIDNNSQIISSRIMPRIEPENGSVPYDRRDRINGPDKERIMAKSSNKLNNREDAQLESQSPLAKGKPSRAPRTGSATLVSSPNYPRLSGAIEGWEQQPSCLNRSQQLSSPVNRKRPLPSGSSSPPVTQWVGQRPQKISRTRRANVVSPVSNFDDCQAFPEVFAAHDAGAKLSSLDSSSFLNSSIVANGSHQLKLRPESVPSPAGLSESDESGVIEDKSDKGRDSGEMEDSHLSAPPKVSDFSSPSKKNKIRLKEEIGDGVRRQGRSGRNSTQLKALPLAKMKQENADTIKLLKNGRPAIDKSESRVGRPPSKKLSDRKTYSRPLASMHSGSSDLIGEPEDDIEALLTAVNAIRSFNYNACSSSFWRTMETVFSFVSSADLTFVKHQIKLAEELDESLSSILEAEFNVNMLCGEASSLQSSSVEQLTQANILGTSSFIDSICSAEELQQSKGAVRKTETQNWFDKIIPLSQRLLSALIADDGAENLNYCSGQADLLLQYSNDCSTYGTSCYLESEFESSTIKSDLDLDLDYLNQKNCAVDGKFCNGFAAHCGSMASIIQTSLSSSNSSYECQFEHMPLNERILLELHSIGIYPDLVPDLAEGESEEIDNHISDLKVKFFQQARKRKNQLYKLEMVIHGVKEVQEKNLEQLAMNKLVEMAYKKLLGGRGNHGYSHKSGFSKISKQLAHEFAKRTLIRCHMFEETAQTCFGDPPIRDVLFSALQHTVETKPFDSLSSNNAERHENMPERVQFVPFQSLSSMPDQPFCKNDTFSNRGRKKEALLDDVVTSAASRSASSHYNLIPMGPKWKKSDKDHALTKAPVTKSGHPSLSIGRAERKAKSKPKQKISQLSTSGNCFGRPTESGILTSVSETFVNGDINASGIELPSPSGDIVSDLPKDLEDSIFTNLPLNGISIDEFDVVDGLGGHGQDIGSWLNVDEDALQDHDLVGLEIPMDDLSELKLSF